jgi:hypothetical protein
MTGNPRMSRSQSLRRQPVPRLGVAQLILIGCIAAFLAGCSAKREPKETTDVPSPPPRPLVASMDCLSKPLARGEAVPWDVALTLAEISNFAYLDGDEQRTQIRGLGATVVRPIIKLPSYGVVASNDDVVVIAFRGTNIRVAADWLTDVKFIGHRVADGQMHRGFFAATDVIYRDVYDEAMRQGAARKAVWITGHSLGGAMAIAFAYRAANDEKLDPTGIVTFGQPLVVSTPLAQFMLDTFKSKYIRFVNNRDPVTRLVPTFHHAGARVHLTGDQFTFRKPMLSYSTSANAKADATSHLEFHEDERDLEPMTENEFRDFEASLNAERTPPRGPNGEVLMQASIPILSDHFIDAYIDRLKFIGQKNWK